MNLLRLRGTVLIVMVIGIGPHLEGPFYSHTARYAPSDMGDAIEHLESTIDELGPFDGVLGFSQGAALALSYIYDQQVRGEPLPFKFALCFSSVLAFSPDPACAQSVIRRLCARRRDFTTTVPVDDARLSLDELVLSNVLMRVVMPAKKHKALIPDHDLSVYTHGDGTTAPRLMLSQLLGDKIRIPTIHVSGKRDVDFLRDMSAIGRELCEGKLMKTLEHSGSHQPPQKEVEVKAAVRAMEWAIGQSEKMSL